MTYSISEVGGEWEEIQTRTFTRWVNAHLKKRSLKVEDLITDLADGINLINLYEIISEESLGKYVQKPKLKIQQIQNLKTVVTEINKFVGSVGIKLQYSAESINKGEKMQILGMIWCLIHKFEIQDISEEQMNAKEGLLLWCKKKTKGYNGVNIQNFNTSWKNGLGFCALIHKHRPDLIDYDSLDANDDAGNLSKAFTIAEEQLDIPQLLDVDDIVNAVKPDDKSIMTYVAYYWKKFASSNKSEKQARMIARVAQNARDNAKMATDYEERAKKLISWTDEKTGLMSNSDVKSFGNNLSKVQEHQKQFQEFKKSEKPTNTKEKADLAILLVNLQSKQKQEKFPVYYPPEELTTNAINEKWTVLEGALKEYEKNLRDALNLMKHIEMQLGRYRARSKKVLDWQEEKEKWLGGNEMSDPESVPLESLRANVNMLKAFSNELENVKNTLNSAVEVGTQVIDAEHSESDEVMETNIKMKEGNDSVSNSSNDKLKQLEEVLVRREEISAMCVEFSTKSDSLNLVLEGCLTDAVEPVIASNVKDVDVAEEALENNIKQYEDSLHFLSELEELHKKVTDANADPEIYSRIKLSDLKEKCDLTKNKMDEKKETLGPEREKQEKNKKLLDEFNEAASNYLTWGKTTLDEIQKEQDGEFEDQLAQLQKIGQESTKKSSEELEKNSELSSQLESNDIVEQSEYTIGELQGLNEQIQGAFLQRSKGLENQIFAKKMTSVSQEQLDEFRETFQYFDKDKSGALSKNEFKAACASIGEDIPDNELDSVFKSFDTDGDGKITFSEFIDYLVSVAKEGTGYEDVLGAYKELAGGNDLITAGQLGAAMDKEDSEFLMSVMPQKDDAYDYVAYLNKLFGK
eukprot:gene5191-8797_t